MTRIAVIGAGIGGVSLARSLAANHDVVVFEKGRGVGGRMASRYADPFRFDHGAQYFTQRDPRFIDMLSPLLADGTVRPWDGVIARIEGGAVTSLAQPREPHLVGVPNMNSVVKALAHDLDLRAGVTIAPLAAPANGTWQLSDAEGGDQGAFDWVVSTTTAHQTMALFADHGPTDGPLTTTRMAPCYALMLGFTRQLDLPWVGAKVSGSPIDWIGVNSTKPGRDAANATIVVHSTSDWAASHLGQDLELLGQKLGQALQEATGIDPAEAVYTSTHRWASARRLPQEDSKPYLDPLRRLAATGDWTGGSRVEDAVLSALDLAVMIEAAEGSRAG